MGTYSLFCLTLHAELSMGDILANMNLKGYNFTSLFIFRVNKHETA